MNLYVATCIVWLLFGAHLGYERQILKFDTLCSTPFKILGVDPSKYAKSNFTIRKWFLGLLSLVLLGASIEQLLQ